MTTFAKKPDPLWQRLLNHPAFYAVLAAIAMMAVIFLIRESRRDNFAGRMNFLRGGPVISDRATNQGSGLTNKLSPLPSPPVAPTEASNSPPPTATDVPRNPDAEIAHVRAYYTEVDHDAVETLRQESQSTQQYTDFGDFRAGALPAKIHPSKERGIRTLDQAEARFTGTALTQQWFVGKNTGENDGIGLLTSMTLEPTTNGHFKGEIEILRSFFESTDLSEAPVKRNAPTTSFDLAPGMSWMVVLKLPSVPQDDPGASPEGILRIFNSPQFKSKQTEFTLFLEFDTPAANSSK